MGYKFVLAEWEFELVLVHIEFEELEYIEVEGGQCIRGEMEKELISSK